MSAVLYRAEQALKLVGENVLRHHHMPFNRALGLGWNAMKSVRHRRAAAAGDWQLGAKAFYTAA